MRAVVAALALALAAPVVAQANWHPVDEATGQIRDLESLKQLADKFPDSGTLRLRLLNAQIEAEDFAGVMKTLAWLNRRGYVFGEVARQQIPKFVGDEWANEACTLLLPKAEQKEASEVFAVVPAEAGLIEGAIREPADDRLIVTGVWAKGVFGKRSYGGWDGYQPQGVGNISGIAYDPRRNMVWIASGRIDGGQAAQDEFHGLLGMPQGGNIAVRIAAPVDVSISDITVSKDGTIYGSDPIGGGIYEARPEDTAMSVVVAPGTFRSPQGLSTSADGKLLYVSDYRYGLAAISLESGNIHRLTTDLPLILDGIDGLWRYGSELIAMQNGTSPMRISAFALSHDGLSIVGSRILEQAHSDWTEPLSGSIDGDALIYVGTGQWDRYVAGEPGQDKPPLPTQIRRLPLNND